MANVPITSLPEATMPSTGDYLILQGASTQRIKWSALLDKLYPVGCIYQSAKATSPASLFGGTWEQIKDRFILAAGDTYAAGSTGGEAMHVLTVDEMPKHRHEGLEWTDNNKIGLNNGTDASIQLAYERANSESNFRTAIAGGSHPHNNLPPYAAKYAWQRIA